MFYYQLSDRHELRLLQTADAQELFAVTNLNRTHLRQWLPWLDSIQDVTNTRNFIESTLEQFTDRQGLVAAVCYDRRIVGTIGFNRIERQNRVGYIGYWLGQSHQGQGIMTASCQSLMNYAFTVLNLNRLVITCATENNRSQAIPLRLGFTHEGIAREAEWLYDRFVDHHIYTLLARDWHKIYSHHSVLDNEQT
jgi:ribosomal-protein-serine acetyltransferase